MHTRIASLEVDVVQASAGTPSAAVVLCHGFGAPGDDLVSLADALVDLEPALATARFYFPHGPLDLGFGEARAWWLIDVAALQAASRDPEALRRFRAVEPPGLAAARAALGAVVRQVLDDTGLGAERLVLGGFSQGAMLTTDLALRVEERPAGLAVLSGTLLLEETWRTKAAARPSLPVFQGHGRADPILPFSAAQALHQLFTAAGLPTEFFEFDGGHTITPAELTALARFLGRTLASVR